jgi:antibiotic biosynthesis monooxygenase (ABM) superfamily enzyme
MFGILVLLIVAVVVIAICVVFLIGYIVTHVARRVCNWWKRRRAKKQD